MVSIVFDQETRQFSVGQTVGRVGGKIGAHVMNNRGTYLSAGGGALIGGAGARALAKRKALEKGLEPGTPEYKRFVNMATAGGAAVGGGAGALVYRKGRPAYDWAKKNAKEMVTSAKRSYLVNRNVTPGMMSKDRAGYEKWTKDYLKNNPGTKKDQLSRIYRHQVKAGIINKDGSAGPNFGK